MKNPVATGLELAELPGLSCTPSESCLGSQWVHHVKIPMVSHGFPWFPHSFQLREMSCRCSYLGGGVFLRKWRSPDCWSKPNQWCSTCIPWSVILIWASLEIAVVIVAMCVYIYIYEYTIYRYEYIYICIYMYIIYYIYIYIYTHGFQGTLEWNENNAALSHNGRVAPDHVQLCEQMAFEAPPTRSCLVIVPLLTSSFIFLDLSPLQHHPVGLVSLFLGNFNQLPPNWIQRSSDRLAGFILIHRSIYDSFKGSEGGSKYVIKPLRETVYKK